MTSDPVILNLETSTTVCSVNVTRGTEVLAAKEIDEGYSHAENLHLFIAGILQEAGLQPGDLDAVALSSGPGSYTGLRIGSSTTKGLCLALDIPLISLGTLEVMAHALQSLHPGATHFCPMLDAGRMEVYTAVIDNKGKTEMPVQPMILDETAAEQLRPFANMVFGGPGVKKALVLLETLPGARFEERLAPSARHMVIPALEAYRSEKFRGIPDFEPFYLKNFVAGKKKRGAP
jgi:tRNA threonylcarbamoyladenosine biosynthesis protein TsaB